MKMANIIRPLLTASFGLALAFTLSCSDDDGGDSSVGVSEGFSKTYTIENITPSQFTIVGMYYECRENGILETIPNNHTMNYSINGNTLSIGVVKFNGNSTSLTGTWIKENSVSCDHDPYNSLDWDNQIICDFFEDEVSKAVFTQNTLTLFNGCSMWGKGVGQQFTTEQGAVIKVIDCATATETKGTETITITITMEQNETKITATYNGRTCVFEQRYSETERRTACTQAHNKVTAEGGDIDDYYSDILHKEENDCRRSLPLWFED